MAIPNRTPPKAAAALGFAIKSLMTQSISLGAAIIAWPLHHSPTCAIALAMALSYTGARFLELPYAWTALNALFPLACAVSLAVTIPHWFFLIPLLLLLLVYAPALWTRVPYYPTPRAAYALLLAELPADRDFTFVDIGCGFGDLLDFLSARRPNVRFIGIEVGPLPWVLATIKQRVFRRSNLTILYRDMWSYPLDHADMVYTFLSPAAMPRMWQKVLSEMHAGSTFITNSFAVNAPHDEALKVRDDRKSVLYVHRFKGKKSKNGYYDLYCGTVTRKVREC